MAQDFAADRKMNPFPSARLRLLFLVVDLDAELLAHLLDVDVHRSDDLLVRIGLAINDNAMLELLGAIDLELAEVRETVVPTTVPDSHEVGVLLEGPGQLR